MEQMVSLDYKPRVWQEHFHRNKKSQNVLVCHRRAGKSVVGEMEMIHCALEKPKQRLAYVAPYQNQATKVMWGPICERARKVPKTEISETAKKITFINGSTIQLFGADNPDAIRGLGFHGLVLDEYADFDPDVFGQVLVPTLAADKGWLLIIGTPKGIDPLSNLYFDVEHDDSWYSRRLSYQDTGVFDEETIQKMRKTMRPRQFALEMECSFDAGTPDTLISGQEVDEAEARVVAHYEVNEHAVILGVDVARFGDDRTVIVRRQGPKMFPPIVMKDANTIEIAKAVCDEFYRHPKADAIFLDYSAGLGGGVADQLEAMGLKPICVHFNGKPRNSRFANTRAEMWWEMCDWITNVGTIPFIKGFKSELSSPKYSKDKNDRVIMEAKEDLKKRGLSSPDIADALALTFYMPVLKGASIYNAAKNHKTPEWDPWKDE